LHSDKSALRRLCAPIKSPKFTKKFAKLTQSISSFARIAPILLHPPVNRLHCDEKQADKLAHFLLTKKLKRVKTYSFFDSF